MYCPDNLDMFERHEAEREAELQKLPECDYCGEYVTGEHFFLINDEVICPDCLNEHFRKDVSEHVG